MRRPLLPVAPRRKIFTPAPQVCRNLRYGPAGPGLMALNEAASPPTSSFLLPDVSANAPSREVRGCHRRRTSEFAHPGLLFTDTPAGSTSLFMLSLRVQAAVTSGATRVA